MVLNPYNGAGLLPIVMILNRLLFNPQAYGLDKNGLMLWDNIGLVNRVFIRCSFHVQLLYPRSLLL